VKLLSRIALIYAKYAPRGHWKVMRFAASRDLALQDFPLEMSGIPGTRIRADFRETVYLPMFRHGCIPHQRGLDKFLKAVLLKGDTVFDIGANVGYTSLLLSSLVGDEGIVHAFEPGERIFKQLKRNTEMNCNVSAWNLAIGDRVGSIEFYECDASDISSVIPVSGARRVTSEVTTIDQFFMEECAGGRLPSLLKIDVEGFEPSVLRGAQSLMETTNPPIVIFESLNHYRLLENLAAIPKFLFNRALIVRIGEKGVSRKLSDENLSSDFAMIPPEASERVRQFNWLD
jgi:FkbM family methyltransferase